MLEEKNKLEKIEKIFNNLERQFKLAKSEFEEYKELVSLNREELNEKHPVFKEYDDKEFEHYVYVLSKHHAPSQASTVGSHICHYKVALATAGHHA